MPVSETSRILYKVAVANIGTAELPIMALRSSANRGLRQYRSVDLAFAVLTPITLSKHIRLMPLGCRWDCAPPERCGEAREPAPGTGRGAGALRDASPGVARPGEGLATG